MADVEIKRKIRLSRKQAGERLIAVGKALAGGANSELEFDGESITSALPTRWSGSSSWRWTATRSSSRSS